MQAFSLLNSERTGIFFGTGRYVVKIYRENLR